MKTDLLVDEKQAEELKNASQDFVSHTLSKRQQCDLEMLINGGFAPLKGFHDRKTYQSVIDSARLPDGTPWPVPIVLDVTPEFAEKLEIGQKVALRDAEGFMP
ncbi:MAG TPA: adenylyltransferase, partial [Chromatiales bacterium]|nr:adenylyltransferase [Chromatiales bacterium]